ncbi:CAMK family protein kinase [Tritrichomonas foetus]|uniref:CAMK family protein kinase n=1 Tax=Tritrichomonas foetus TaxID=1144522 RepID=A0A1J4L214_9EUKA|nr:CAMK family protein kinase [Tritrichomonas foetus]|eukprot:OHT15990.1 CAMK family protein kinase [Tritrichomonas foetus]
MSRPRRRTTNSLTIKSKDYKDPEIQRIIASLPFSSNGYLFSQVLGSGSFGVVFKAYHSGYKRDFAAKMISMVSKDQASSDAIDIESEFKTLMRLSHQNIIKIYGSFQYMHQFVIILQYCPNGTLKNLIQSGVGIPKDEQKAFIKSIVNALTYSHEKNVAHRDIKTANIFIDSFRRPILSDFGLSQILPLESASLFSFCGSFIYRSPEMILQKPHDPFKADVWALGVTFYIMVTGRDPWPTYSVDAMKKAIVSCQFEPFPETVEPEIVDLIKLMLTLDPNQRPSMAELSQLDWIQNSEMQLQSKRIETGVNQSQSVCKSKRFQMKYFQSVSQCLSFKVSKQGRSASRLETEETEAPYVGKLLFLPDE